MPTTTFQRIVFAFLTVIITVLVFVCYNLSIEMGDMTNAVFHRALTAAPIQFGLFKFINIIAVEFAFAFLLEILFVGKLANVLAFSVVNPRENKPFVIMIAIICATVCLMCPMMSFIATILYNGINVNFFANWMEKVFHNLPLAFFSQLFFIQPLVRFIFGLLYRKQLATSRSS